MKKNFLTRLLQASLMCCMAVLFTACDDMFGSEDNPISAYLTMSDKDVTIKVDETYTRTAIAVSDAVIEYSSSDVAIATVNNEGAVKGVAPGTAIITAKATGYSTGGKKIFVEDSKSYKVIVLAKTPATITTAPTATASIAPNTTTALVTAGVADGGTVMYKVTNVNTKPTSTDGFSATIPTAATLAAGTYYVWYYAKGDADHSDSEIAATAIEVKVQSGLLAGKFTINTGGDKVQFSQGNLQATYDGTKWTWAFAANQWDCIGNAAGNTKVTDSSPFISENATVDLFGWVGASSTWTGAAQYGITSSTATGATDGYGNVANEALKADWGTNMGTGWRTLTSAEWTYLFSTRTSGGTVFGTASARYAHAEINTDGTPTKGIILFPDGVDIAASEVTTAGTVNIASSWGTKCTSAQWTALADKGCVFLPVAGYRSDTWVYGVVTAGRYWSSSPYTSVDHAYCVYFGSGSLNPGDIINRSYGFSVRLVRAAE